MYLTLVDVLIFVIFDNYVMVNFDSFFGQFCTLDGVL